MARTESQLVAWLSGIEWGWFETLTFAREQSTWTALKHYETWSHQIEIDSGAQRRALAVCEEGKLYGRLHIHAVAHMEPGLFRVPREELEDRWEMVHGWARIREFRPDQAGLAYVTKYVLKAELTERCDYRYVGDWSRWNTGSGSTSTRGDGASPRGQRPFTSGSCTTAGTRTASPRPRLSADTVAWRNRGNYGGVGVRVIEPD